MSSKNNHILDEIIPLLEKNEDRDDLRVCVDILSAYRPKISIDRSFQEKFRNTLLSAKVERKRIFWWNSLYPFFSVFSVAFACFTLAIGYFDILFPKDFKQVIPEIQKETVTSFREVATGTKIEESSPLKIQEFKNEKASIDAEMSSIVDEINSLDIASTTLLPTIDTSSPPIAKISRTSELWADSIPAVPPLAQMSPMMLSVPEYSIPEYPSKMNIYKKSGEWTDAEITARSGSGIIAKNMLTEKRSLITTKIEALLTGKIISWTNITYKILSKIAVESGNFSYLVPVIEYTTTWWERISIPLIRGFR